ncbi:MAG: phospholipase [Rhodothermaceae bacterium]|nr:phospholipase [Rhodothermaceae bacterium]
MTDRHARQPVRTAGAPLAEAAGAVVLVHGRGASAESILGLVDELGCPDWSYLAPQAADWTWYPHSFMAPIEANEPKLSSALRALGSIVEQIEATGLDRKQIVLAGFSQGACLTAEFAARHAGRWGGVVVLAGGLIGPEGTPRDYAGRFEGMPVFLGCADNDPHIPLARVNETADVFTRMGADVDPRIYPGLGHTVNADELDAFRAMLDRAEARNSRALD